MSTLEETPTPDWQNHPIFTRADGSFVITKNAMPFHVPHEGEFAELWEQIQAFTQENPGSAAPEPAPPPPTEEELEEQRRAHILARLNELDLASIRPLRAIAEGAASDEDRQRLAAIEEEAAELRAELAELSRLADYRVALAGVVAM